MPGLFTRLVHFYGTDAKLRVFRYERWIPAKWIDMHRLYMRGTEIGVDRVPTQLASAGSGGTQWTLEQEYLFVLLVHQLNTGNLSPLELDWASSQLRAWSRKLSLDAVPRSPEGFFVDVAGKQGLVRRTGNDSGSMLRYLDTTPIAEQLERAVYALRQSEATDQGPAAPINQQRIAILEKMRPAISPNLNADLRRDPRVAVAVAAKVRIGLSRICRDLAAKDLNERRTTPRRAPSRSRCTRSPTRRGCAAASPTSTIRSPRRSRRSPTRCGGSRTGASRACASPRPAASGRR